jgi:hypothetical protein
MGYRWFAASGGVMPPRQVREAPPVSPRPQGRRLSTVEREEIAHLHRLEKTLGEIAVAIGFHKSTISRELRRNTSSSQVPRVDGTAVG